LAFVTRGLERFAEALDGVSAADVLAGRLP
jgi:hypothetical protein